MPRDDADSGLSEPPDIAFSIRVGHDVHLDTPAGQTDEHLCFGSGTVDAPVIADHEDLEGHRGQVGRQK